MALLDDIARGPSAPNPLAQLAGVQQLQGQQQIQQARGIQMQGEQTENGLKSLALGQGQQQQQDQQDIRAAYAASTNPQTGQVDRPTLLSTLAKLNPTVAAQTASGLATQDNAAKEAAAKTQETQIALAQAHLKLKDQLLQGTNAATWPNTRAIALQNGLSPQEIPEQYPGDAWVAQAHAQTMTQQQTLDAHLAQQKQADVEAGQTETNRHNQATESQAAAALANTAANEAAQRKLQGQTVGIEAGKLGLEQKKFDLENGTGNTPNSLVDAIGQGHINPDRLGYLLSRNPALLQGVMSKYPDFDSSKAASYPATYKDFTSGKTSVALNAGSTALGHLNELKDLNTIESRVPGTADYQAYQNKVDTLATELAKFYGDSTVSGIANIKKTLSATFNRDAAIKTQAQSMGDKLDAFQQTWDNAAPSKSYQAPMPGISPKAAADRAAILGTKPAAGGGKVVVTAPDGSQHPFDNQAQADKFKASAGIK